MNIEQVYMYISTTDYETGYYVNTWDLTISRIVRPVVYAIDIEDLVGGSL